MSQIRILGNFMNSSITKSRFLRFGSSSRVWGRTLQPLRCNNLNPEFLSNLKSFIERNIERLYCISCAIIPELKLYMNNDGKNNSRKIKKISPGDEEESGNKKFKIFPGADGMSGGSPLYAVGIAVAILFLFMWLSSSAIPPQISWDDFVINYLSRGLVQTIVVYNNNVVRFTTNQIGMAPSLAGGMMSQQLVIGSVDYFEEKLDRAIEEFGIPKNSIKVYYQPKGERTSPFNSLLSILSLFALGAVLMSIFKRGPGMDMFNFKKTIGKMYGPNQDGTGVTFKDVAGCTEAKREILDFVEFLKNPQSFRRLGARIPRGALLFGKPGTGKTLLAKAVAGEANVPFFSVAGSEFHEIFVGMGSSRIRSLFAKARENAPSIIFIDEIDAVGSSRQGPSSLGRHQDYDATINQLLTEMDGFDALDNVVVLAGTNRLDKLDPALLRPGRFDRHIYLSAPDLNDRVDVFKIYLKKIKITEDIDEIADRLAKLTVGFTGADIKNICNEAAILAARNKADSVTSNDFESAVERVLAGSLTGKKLSVKEKYCVCVHEAGHAIAAWFLKHSHPVMKISIIPRGKALGYNQLLPKDVNLMTTEELLDQMCVLYGGRVAEHLVIGSITNGALDDLQKVTKMAYLQVGAFGMDKDIGNMSFKSFVEDENVMFKRNDFSESLGNKIDEKVSQILKSAYERTISLIESKKDLLLKLATFLNENETANQKDLISLLGVRPFEDDEESVKQQSESKSSSQSETTIDESK